MALHCLGTESVVAAWWSTGVIDGSFDIIHADATVTIATRTCTSSTGATGGSTQVLEALIKALQIFESAEQFIAEV